MTTEIAIVPDAVELDEQLRTRIAWYYYVESLTQGQIAQRLGINRIRVNRLLAQCREEGLVQIRINSKLAPCIALEQQLAARFGLDEVVVIPRPIDDDDLPVVIGAACGNYLSDKLQDLQSVGIGWGRTLRFSLRSVNRRPLQGLSVVSLLGGLTRASAINTYETASRLANLFDAECYYIAAPAFTSTEESRNMFLAQDVLREVYDKAKRVDIAIVSVGDLGPSSTIRQLGLISEEELDSLEAAGAVGDLLGHYLNAEGQVVDHPINRRVVALSPADLKRIPKVVLASGGRHKVPILRGVLSGGYVNVLITDDGTAGQLVGAAG